MGVFIQQAADCSCAFFHVKMKANSPSERQFHRSDRVFKQRLWSHLSKEKFHSYRTVERGFFSAGSLQATPVFSFEWLTFKQIV